MDGWSAGGQLPAWRGLPALALAAVADARCASRDRSATDPARPDPVAVAQLVRGLEVLAVACGGDASIPSTDPHRVLATVADLTAELADAARHVAWTAGFCGQEQAAEVADAIMTTAWALRVLAELGLHVVPAPDGGEPAPPRDPAP
ncbi:hypothetical protein [Actinomycetospora chiangmaiensis]|uniref:hypothetical protein n=1 Tax=Actinomycetospora chiangmaiensis TaxID=402650 RepID=UPI0003A809CF|nr:hypothetical protein [Actinomycetospora chiangmaiensis]